MSQNHAAAKRAVDKLWRREGDELNYQSLLRSITTEYEGVLRAGKHLLKIADTYRGDGDGNLIHTTHSSLPSALEGLRTELEKVNG